MNRCCAILACSALFSGLTLTGGCVSRAEYERLVDMNRKVDKHLENCKASVRTLQGDKDKLIDDLRDKERTLSNLQANNDSLIRERDELKDGLDKLKALYDKTALELLNGGIGPLPAPVDRALQDFARANPESVEYLPKYGMVKLKSDLTFEKGSATVQSSAVGVLEKFVEIISSPEAQKFHVYVAGHTDDIPIKKPATLRRHPTNWYLSVHRAVGVEKVLTKAGMAPERIGVLGFGEYHPIAPNEPGNKGNPINRRVEIWIVPAGRFLTADAAPTASDASEASEAPEK